MVFRGDSLKWVVVALTILHPVDPLSANCHFSFVGDYKLYDFSLDTPIPLYPHGVQSEDGFYKVVGNKTVIWFQLCDGMIFNHDPPRCVDCSDCGGPSHCGMGCSALVAKNTGGYDVCTNIGRASSMDINIIDKNNPHIGVIVKMSSNGLNENCSLSVSVICDPYGFQGPYSLEKTGTCNYGTVLKHPSGCAKIVHVSGKGWGWFATFLIIVLCIFGVYLLAGAVYRYCSLGVSGIDIIPNLDFWTGLPQQAQSVSASLLHKFRGSSQGYRSSYSPVNF
ncbi:uncharacterized protein LOC112200297 isoform X1 [Rosa chinensis]|uniref:uncharacterized protein LOC112200297 isoform X1 n=2 Tax=Rosa chinensis TaxID=74649 RepID=UPI000D0892D8|nr:uncharacterized protein LOC112200297 isoform X1 [Rosa chinensis]